MIYIVDEIGSVVQSMRNGTGAYEPYYDRFYEANTNGAPFYLYGHRQEISNRLTQKNIDPIKKKQRYPLIALKMDIAETVRGDVHDFRLNLVIATISDIGSNAEQRMEKTFKPILYPLYSRFLLQFGNAGKFFWDGQLDQQYPPHVKIDRPFWGTEGKEGNIKNIFNDPVDAIEIVDLNFSMREINC